MSKSIFEAYNGLKKDLAAAGIEDCVFEAKQIIKHITGYANSQILMHYNDKLTPFQENNLTAIIKQRLVRYPLQYILGKWDFYGRSFFVGPGVLIPRADTETVIEQCLKVLEGKENPKIIDLCSGTGCIGITLAKEVKNSRVMCLEKYEEAARYIAQNIAQTCADNASYSLGDVLKGDLNKESYDLIVSNPPYVKSEEMKALQKELSYEPETALLGGEDGLDFYKAIIKNYKNSLKEKGVMLFEIGFSQGEAVAELLREAGFKNVQIVKDLNQNDRVVFGTVA